MKLTERNSETITFLRVILVFFVMLAHSYLIPVNLSDGTLIIKSGFVFQFTQELFSRVIATLSSPLFFVISGFLLFRDQQVTWDLVKSKWMSRVFTLVIPFFLWNAIFLFVFILGQTIPLLENYFPGSVYDLNNITLHTILNAFIGFDGEPVNAPLWFLRDLILLVLVSPLLYPLLKRFKYAVLILLLFVWYGFFIDFYPIPVVEEKSIFFFSLGLFLHQIDTSRVEDILQVNITRIGLASAYIILAGLEAYLNLSRGGNVVLHNTVILVGVVTAYSIVSDMIHIRVFRKLIYTMLPVTYLLFLSHNIILQTFRKGAYVFIRPESDVLHLSIYFGAPILTTASVYLFYIVMRKILPRILALLTGGRMTPTKNYSYSSTISA